MNKLLPHPYILGLGMAILSYTLIYGLKRLLATHVSEKCLHSPDKWSDILLHALEKTGHVFMVGTALYIAYHYVPHHPIVSFYVKRVYFVLTMVQVCIWTNDLLNHSISSAINRRMRFSRAAATSIGLIKLTSKLLIFSVIFLFTLNNLDIKITTILAGLGVGGIAVALALQKILGDLFSSLSIVLDRPFVVGDFIIMQEYMGEVEKIGIRTTHIRGLGGEQIIISNSDLLSTRIRNMRRMHERRVVFTLSLSLDLKADEIQKAVDIMRAIVQAKRMVRYDRVHLMQVSRTSFDFEIVYYVLSDDYNTHMDIKQEILLSIYQAFAHEGFEFALPVQAIQHSMAEVRVVSDLVSSPQEKSKDKTLS